MNVVERLRALFALPDMCVEELAAFRRAQVDKREPFMVPTVVAAALLIAGFVGWDLLREPGPLGRVAGVRLAGALLVLALLAAVRRMPHLGLRAQGIVLYVAVYASQAAVGVALGAASSLQMPGLLIVMFAGVIALPRARDTWVNVLLAALSVPLVLPTAPRAADVVYAVAHFATVILLVWVACALMERASAQGFAYRRRLQQEASTDALTGVRNRRAFEAGIGRELERARRTGLPLAFAIIDVDHFKRVNDDHGHDTGDRLLVAVAQALQAHVRSSDLLARIGGEEFALAMLDAPAPAHLLMLERLRHAVRSLAVPAGDGATIGCTVSIGVAERTPADTDWSALHKRADQALYAAKASGRDRVIDAANLAPSPA